jgi:hypothetical protein
VAAPANPTIKTYTNANAGINPVTFVALIVPVDCSGYMLKNSGPDTIYMRSNPADPNTEDSMGAGFYEDVLMDGTGHYQRRFVAGQTLYFVKCTGPLIGKFFY